MILFDTIFISFEILVEMFLLAVCNVAIHLVYVNANLFLSLSHFRMLSRLSLDISAIFATGYTLYFVSACCEHFQLSSECQISKELVDPNEVAVFPHETSAICSVVRFIIIDTVC